LSEVSADVFTGGDEMKITTKDKKKRADAD
jgi:hypothetical protein